MPLVPCIGFPKHIQSSNIPSPSPAEKIPRKQSERRGQDNAGNMASIVHLPGTNTVMNVFTANICFNPLVFRKWRPAWAGVGLVHISNAAVPNQSSQYLPPWCSLFPSPDLMMVHTLLGSLTCLAQHRSHREITFVRNYVPDAILK